jgi:GNAT superfamily N-acetyltransferase
MGSLVFTVEDVELHSDKDDIIHICMSLPSLLDISSLCSYSLLLLLISPAALFIYPKYQGLGYGNVIMDILERMCLEEHGCSIVTLATRAYEDDELKTPSRNKLWYERRGYVEYRVRCPFVGTLKGTNRHANAESPSTNQDREPRWPDPVDEDLPLYVACFLRKTLVSR